MAWSAGGRARRRLIVEGASLLPCRCHLFSSAGVGVLTDDDLGVAQAMADIATIGILQERVIRDKNAFASQLEFALESRVAIEQAKGIVAQHHRINVDEAFTTIRQFTRDHNRLLSDTARQIIDGTLAPEQLVRTTGPS